jgi:hypothetical protein
MSEGPNKNNDNLMLKMKKRTQEFLNAANAAAAQSIHQKKFQTRSVRAGHISNSSNYTEFGNMGDGLESKSAGKVDEFANLNPISQSQMMTSFDNDRQEKLIQGGCKIFLISGFVLTEK